MDDLINTWTPGRIVEAIERGWTLPADWRAILEDSPYELPYAPLDSHSPTP